MVQDDTTGPPGTPVTVACNVTGLLAGIVTAAGETVTVTLLGSNPLPRPQPVIKQRAMIPATPTKAALTIEFLAIDLIIIRITFRKRRLADFRGLALGILEVLARSHSGGLKPRSAWNIFLAL